MWDVTAGKVLKAFQEHQGPVHAVEYHPKELLLASAGADRYIVLINLGHKRSKNSFLLGVLNFGILKNFNLSMKQNLKHQQSGKKNILLMFPLQYCDYSLDV